jgi:hypothetical protein
MERLVLYTIATALLAVGAAVPGTLDARNNTCTIKATKDVDVQAHYLRGRGDLESPRRKSDVIWSGNMERGNTQEVMGTRGKILVSYRDLTKSRTRPINRSVNCQNGNTILVPR